jgi:hypothetical protein
MKAKISTPVQTPVRRDSIAPFTIFSHNLTSDKYIAIRKDTDKTLFNSVEYLSVDMRGVVGWCKGDCPVYVHGKLMIWDDKLPEQD